MAISFRINFNVLGVCALEAWLAVEYCMPGSIYADSNFDPLVVSPSIWGPGIKGLPESIFLFIAAADAVLFHY